MTRDIDVIGLDFYRVGLSAESKLSTNISRPSCVTFHQQYRIDVYFVEISFLESFPRKKNKKRHTISLQSKIFNN